MADIDNEEEVGVFDDDGDGGEDTPVCLGCMRPIDPQEYYCPHCGEASGQLLQCLPYLDNRWHANMWGKAIRQTKSRDVSMLGRVVRGIMIALKVPILLIGLLFREDSESEKDPRQDVDALDLKEDEEGR